MDRDGLSERIYLLFLRERPGEDVATLAAESVSAADALIDALYASRVCVSDGPAPW